MILGLDSHACLRFRAFLREEVATALARSIERKLEDHHVTRPL